MFVLRCVMCLCVCVCVWENIFVCDMTLSYVCTADCHASVCVCRGNFCEMTPSYVCAAVRHVSVCLCACGEGALRVT